VTDEARLESYAVLELPLQRSNREFGLPHDGALLFSNGDAEEALVLRAQQFKRQRDRDH
jgi:hypothetical protein